MNARSIFPILVISGFSLPANAAVLELFSFSDTAGTGLANVTNTGTVGTAWNFNVNGQPGETATDGNGLLFVGANATAGTSTISSDYTRKVVFATTLTDGAFTFEYRLASWDLNDTGALNAAEDQEGITIKLNTSDGGSVNLISALNATSANVRARHTVTGGSLVGTSAQTNLGLNAADLVIRVEGDLTTGAFTSSYNLGGAGFNTLISDGAGLNDISEIVMFIEGGTAGWSGNDSISFDYMSLDAIPEPSAALLGGLGVLVLLRRRR